MQSSATCQASRHSGHAVTREDLYQRLWPDGNFVDFEHSLNAAIKKLRGALGDDAENPRFVETLAKRGYRFITPVESGGLAPIARRRPPDLGGGIRGVRPNCRYGCLACLPKQATAPEWREVPLTSYPGFERSPSFSPDGTRLRDRGGWVHNRASVCANMQNDKPVFNRWLIPIGAVLVHLCIGSVYSWSTFNRPIQALFPNDPSWFRPPYITFTTALVLLGLSAAFGGPWVERKGPRVAAKAAALFFGTGLMIGGAGLAMRQSALVFLGMGMVGGIGSGLGYISPVSTLVKWFPDRRGMATGMAIMGFGGGAALGAPLNTWLMSTIGVANTMLALGAAYLVVMLAGAAILRRPPQGWMPEGWTPPEGEKQSLTVHVTRNQALATMQFWLLWGILFVNVTAGIGILAQASPMMQDMFLKTPVVAAGIVSIISLFNAGGRFMWASASDYIGRRNTYTTFFVVQAALFLAIPELASRGQWGVFEASLFTVFTMYGGGFATIPAFLADLFGTDNVGAIHGALLTAWSAAAVAGPVIITELSNRAKVALGPGESRIHIYDRPLEVLAGLLAVGFVLTLLVRPLAAGDNDLRTVSLEH